MNDREKTVKELIRLIETSHAHVTLQDALTSLPEEARNAKPSGVPYSIWQLVEHMRIAQADIVDFSASADYPVLDWPKDYWPDDSETATNEAWDATLEQLEEDKQRFFELLRNPDSDLFAPFPWGDGQTLFREALLISDHNAYHVAEIVVIRRLLGNWRS